MSLNNRSEPIFAYVTLGTKTNRFVRLLCLSMGASLLHSTNVLGISPGEIQQIIQPIPQPPQPTAQKITAQKGKPETRPYENDRQARLRELLNIPGMREKIKHRSRHPLLTNTAKSIFSPAGIPMKWGGIGFGGEVFDRFPTQTKNTYSGDAAVVVPFGNSDKIIGGAVAAGIADMGKNTSFGGNGLIGVVLSRWVGRHTIITGGAANVVPWGAEYQNAAHSYFGGVTHLFGPKIYGDVHPLGASVGIGTGAFGPIRRNNFAQVSIGGDSKVYPFANAAFNVTSNLALIGDYYSETFAVGVSYTKAIILPFNFMIYAANLRHTDNAPSTTVGLRIATGFAFPAGLRGH